MAKFTVYIEQLDGYVGSTEAPDYIHARAVADKAVEEYPGGLAEIKDQHGNVVYRIEGFGPNVIPIRPDIRPQGVTYGT